MEAVVPRTHQFPLLDPERRIGCQPAAPCIEPELGDEIGAGVVFRRFQDIVLQPGDVWDEGEAIGRIGRDCVGAIRRLVPVEGRCVDRAVRSERMHRGVSTLVIGRQQKPAGPVRREECRRVGGCDTTDSARATLRSP